MKKIIFLLLSSILGFAQQTIEVKLVDQNIGLPEYYQNISNDSGLNTILSNHNVTIYETKIGNPFDISTKYVSVACNNCNQVNLKNDLQNYSSVIASAEFANYEYFNNVLTIKLVTATIGTQTGINGNIIVTNDVGLNQIFQNFNIVEMNLYCSTCIDNNFTRIYNIRSSSCDVIALKTALDNYTSVIENTELIAAYYLLNNESFNKNNTSIYPNPFQNELYIETHKTITTYEVVDISGKTIVNSNNKIDFDNSISQLSSGLYILQLNYEDGTNSAHKIVKN